MTLPAVALLWATAGAAPPDKSSGHSNSHGNGHGNGHGDSHSKAQDHNGGHGGQSDHGSNQYTPRFTNDDKTTIRAYFDPQITAGNCPPGLAKKNNGCLPPGQARKWAEGRPLPAGTEFYPLPPDLLARLNPPLGYGYVRTGSDVLLIASGTNMVMAGLRDLLR